MTSKIPICFQKTWASVPPSQISTAHWPFRFYDVEKVESCEEVLGLESWNEIQQAVMENKMECLSNVWNAVMIKQYREMCAESFPVGTPISLGRNLFHQVLAKHFEGHCVTHQKISLKPVEIYISPCHYVRYNPHVDLCIFNPSGRDKVSLNIIEKCSKHGVADGMHQTMFCTLSGDRCTGYCFVIKATLNGKFKVFLGKIVWPKSMHQMLMVCGSDISRQLGFNHRKHRQDLSATYAYIGEVDAMEDDCPVVPLFLNMVDVLMTDNSEPFLPLTPIMKEIVEKRKRETKHISMCCDGDVECCNNYFDLSSSSDNNP